MYKYLITAIIVIGIALGGYYFIKNNQSSNTPSPSVSDTSVVNTDNTEATTSATAPVEQTTAPKTYTMAQVSAHGTSADCWTVVNGVVYNLTAFIPNHPGGRAIIQACGKDGTALFNSVDDHVEQNAQATLDAFKIGTVTK